VFFVVKPIEMLELLDSYLEFVEIFEQLILKHLDFVELFE